MRSSTLFSMGLLALSVSIGVVGCGDDDDDGNGGVAGKGGNTSTAGKGGGTSTAGKGGSTSTAGKGGSTSTAGKGGTNGDAGGGGEPATAGNGPIGGEGGNGGAAGADTGGQTGEGGGGGEVAATDVGVNGAKVLTDAAGMSLYVRDGDTVSTDTPDSKCANGCPGWPVFKVDVASVPAELDAGDFKSFNGSLGDQTAYKGHPLYYFGGDGLPGQTNGDGLGPWHVVKIPFTP